MLEEGQQKGRHLRFTNDDEEWAAFCRAWVDANTHIVLEATGSAWHTYDLLSSAGAGEILVAHPLKVKAIASARVKTDKADATTLAELGRAGLLPTVYVPTVEERTLRSLLARHFSLTKAETAQKNQLYAALRRQGIRYPKSRILTVEGRAFLEKGLGKLPPSEALIVRSCLEIADRLAAEEQAILAEMARVVEEGESGFREDVERLMTGSGVGFQTAVAIRARLGDIRRFPTARHAVSYIGLAPRVRNSGGTSRTGSISREGDRVCRFLLVQAAWAAIRAPGNLARFYERLSARKGAKIAITATARRLLLILVAILRTKAVHRDVNPAQVERKLKGMRAMAIGHEAALQKALQRTEKRKQRVAELLHLERERQLA